ncbi:hypothetical protein GCM10009754_48490 [Amycolatopsis minnesotensis]|uniref:Uncharacterized protein n=1 Tax=Amycolatopsis minnesotensis TaxID=337894 RepID=A0ABP5CXB9_9PSEU
MVPTRITEVTRSPPGIPGTGCVPPFSTTTGGEAGSTRRIPAAPGSARSGPGTGSPEGGGTDAHEDTSNQASRRTGNRDTGITPGQVDHQRSGFSPDPPRIFRAYHRHHG